MSESSSSSSSSGSVTKLTTAGKVPARHFMDIPTEERQLGKRATAMRSLVMLILAAVAVKLYHQKEEVIPEVQNYVRQRMIDTKGLWAKVDMREYKKYIAGFFTIFTNKKYALEVTPEGNSFLYLLKWKKIKKFNVPTSEQARDQ